MTTSGNLLCRASNYIHNVILKDSKYNISRILTSYQPSRNRRRCDSFPSWFVKLRGGDTNQDLTTENVEFLKEQTIKETEKKLVSPLKESPWPRQEWSFRTYRCGVIGLKLGTTLQWLKSGKEVHCSVIQVLDNHVIDCTPPHQYKLEPGWKPWFRDRYCSVTVGCLNADPSQYSEDYNRMFLKSGVPTKRKLSRFLVSPKAAIQPGLPLNVRHYKLGQYVDVQGKSIDHGFQGVVKRFNFKGGRASHGTTKNHRRPGSIGHGRRASGLLKGIKLPGHMGNDHVTVRGLRIIRIDYKNNLLYIKGNVPGSIHGFVRVFDTILPNRRGEIARNRDYPPMPTCMPEDLTKEDLKVQEVFHETLFCFDDPSLTFEDVEEVKDKKKSK